MLLDVVEHKSRIYDLFPNDKVRLFYNYFSKTLLFRLNSYYNHRFIVFLTWNVCVAKGVQQGKAPLPKVSRMSGRFVLRETVFKSKCCRSLKVKVFGSSQNCGLSALLMWRLIVCTILAWNCGNEKHINVTFDCKRYVFTYLGTLSTALLMSIWTMKLHHQMEERL